MILIIFLRRMNFNRGRVAIILKWLPDIYKKHIGTGDLLVRSLISAKESFNPSVIIDLFNRDEFNFSIKSGFEVALVYAPTEDISIWLKDQLLNHEYALELKILIFRAAEERRI